MRIEILPVEGLPEIQPGADLCALLADAIVVLDPGAVDGDLLVVCQKVVSKAEGRIVELASVTPSAFAERVAPGLEKDPRLVELVLRESRRIVKMKGHHLIVETHHGFVCANAGIDASNVVSSDSVILLPVDPDASAIALRDGLAARLGHDLPVVITDTFGRPWREGQLDVAIGVAGLDPISDLRGQRDRSGRELHHTVLATGDAIAAAAGVVMGKAEGIPAAIVKGLSAVRGEGSAQALVRPGETDLFR